MSERISLPGGPCLAGNSFFQIGECLATTNVAVPRRTNRLVAFALLLFGVPVLLGVSFYLFPGFYVTRAQRYRMWRMGLQSQTVMLSGYPIHYLVAGEGKPVVMIHGLGGRAEDWLALIPALTRSGYKVYAPDLLGFGRSARPDVDYSIALQTDVIRQFMDSQKLQLADVVGWSMGGWIALRLAEQSPGRVRRLVVIDSAGLKFDAVNAGALRPKNEADLARMMQVLTPHPRPIPSFYARELLHSLADQDWIIDRAMKSMYTGKDLMDGKMDAVKMPVLIVWGDQDVLTPLSIGEHMHDAMPQSVLQVVHGCGHLAPVECSPRVLSGMMQFLNANPPLPAARKELVEE
jgi:pimeloyl-ACP methyl ester carboxylesterase